MLGFPAITVRNAIERPEAIDAGTIVMTGMDPDVILNSIRLQMARGICDFKYTIPHEYEIDNTSHRVVKLIVGTAKLSHLWDNIRLNDLA